MSDSDIEAGLAAAADSLHLDCESFRGEIVDLEKRVEELSAAKLKSDDDLVKLHARFKRLRRALKRRMKQCPRCKGKVKHMGKDFEELTCESCLDSRKALEGENE